MPGISIHLVDVSKGLIAKGLRVRLFRAMEPRELIAEGLINERGLFSDSALDGVFQRGYYEPQFKVGDFYRRQAKPSESPGTGQSLDISFLDVVSYRFGIADPRQHVHPPFKMTAWGYSCFRGGA